MSKSFIERLQYFMEERGINDNQMTVAAGLSTGLIGKLKKNGKGMSSANIEKILLAYPELNASWLMTGEGDMLKGGQAGTTVTVNTSRNHVSGDNNVVGSDNSSVTVQASNTEELLLKQIELLQKQTEQQARMIETLTKLLDAK